MGFDEVEESREWDAAEHRYWFHLKKILFFFESQ